VVPTLSEWGLIVLLSLLAITGAYRVHGRRRCAG
jgi:hypothetical protein